MESHDVLVVGDLQPDAPLGERRAHPVQIFGLSNGMDLLAVEADADEGLMVVEEQQSAQAVAARLDCDLRLIGTVADGAAGRVSCRPATCRVPRASGPPHRTRPAPAHPDPGEKVPLRSETASVEIVGQGKAGRAAAIARLSNRPRQITAERARPAVCGSIGSSKVWRPSAEFHSRGAGHPPMSAGPSTSEACPRDHQRALSVRTMGLWGQCSHGPSIDFDRAAMTM